MAKTKLPLSLITSYITQAWSAIDSINADITASKKEYSNVEEFVDCLQSVSDAYLILAGRLQKYLDDKNYIELPKDDEKVKESLEEDLVVSVENTETGEVSEIASIDLDNLDSFFAKDNEEQDEEEQEDEEVEDAAEDVEDVENNNDIEDDEEDDEEFSMKDADEDEEVENDSDILIADFPSPSLTVITDDDLYSQE